MTRAIIDGTGFATVNANVFSMLTTAEQDHSQRLQRYRTNWRFYKGHHWDWQRDINEPFVTINYAKKFVDTNVNFLMKDGFKIIIPDDPATPAREDENRDFIRIMLEETWMLNNLGLTAIEMAQMGGVTGDCFVRTSWDSQPDFGRPHARIDVLPSRFVFPDFGGPIGVDRKTVNSILILFPRYRTGEIPDARAYGTRAKRLEIFGERWFPDRVEKYDSTRSVSEPFAIENNPLGEIPIIHIPNYPVAGQYFGLSDMEGIIDLQREFNEKATDISDVISYHGSPLTVVSGAKIGQLERGANRIWGVPTDAKVENLELKGDLKASMDYLKLIKKSMHEIASIPEGVLGSFQSSESMSAAAVALRYLPLIETRKVREMTYGLGLKKMNRMIMKLTSIMDSEFRVLFSKLSDRNRFRTEIKFSNPLPRDESIEISKATDRVEVGLTSLRYEQENTMGFSQSEIDKINKDKEQERLDRANLEFEIGQKFGDELIEEPQLDQENRSGNPDPRRPNPESQGESKSISSNKDATI